MGEDATNNIVVQGDVGEIFDLWANAENLPAFMHHIRSVQLQNDRITRWTVSGISGLEMECDMIMDEMTLDQLLSWHSVAGDVDMRMEVRFEDKGDNETEITLTIGFAAAVGRIRGTVWDLVGNPQDMVAQSLRNFKEYMESVYSPLPWY